MTDDALQVEATVPLDELERFLTIMHSCGHEAKDTGERLTTEEGIEAEAKVVLQIRPAPDGEDGGPWPAEQTRHG